MLLKSRLRIRVLNCLRLVADLSLLGILLQSLGPRYRIECSQCVIVLRLGWLKSVCFAHRYFSFWTLSTWEPLRRLTTSPNELRRAQQILNDCYRAEVDKWIASPICLLLQLLLLLLLLHPKTCLWLRCNKKNDFVWVGRYQIEKVGQLTLIYIFVCSQSVKCVCELLSQ